jgi:hypothetical protein
MWLVFLIEPYGARLPRHGNEANAPLWAAIVVAIFGVIILGLILFTGYAWLSGY